MGQNSEVNIVIGLTVARILQLKVLDPSKWFDFATFRRMDWFTEYGTNLLLHKAVGLRLRRCQDEARGIP